MNLSLCRQAPRHSIKTAALVVRDDDEAETVGVVRSRDLSAGGVFVETDRLLSVGDRLKLFIADQSHDRVFRVRARVVRVAPSGFGAEFVVESALGQERVLEFVSQLAA